MKIRNSVCEHPSLDFVIKRKDVEFLNAVQSHNGTATTTEIREQTGWTRNQVNHRFGRLDDAELITVGRAEETTHGGNPPKIAQMTTEGEEAVDEATEQDIVDYEARPREVVDDVREVLEELQRQKGELQQQVDDVEQQFEEVPSRTDSLDSELQYIDEWMTVAERKFRKMERQLDDLQEQIGEE